MIIDVVMPKMGESITEGTILEWKKQVGDSIAMDEILLELEPTKLILKYLLQLRESLWKF